MTDETKRLLDNAIAALAGEDYTVCGVAIKEETEVRPFGNLTNQAEAVVNILSAALVIASSMPLDSGKMTDVSGIERAQQEFIKQHLQLKEA